MKPRILGAMIALFGCAARVCADELAFFYALDADFQALKSEAVATRQHIKIGDRSVQVLTLAKHKIYAVKMGSGAVETAASAQAVLARFRCDRAFSLGPVGGLADELEIGKWYRVASVVPRSNRAAEPITGAVERANCTAGRASRMDKQAIRAAGGDDRCG